MVAAAAIVAAARAELGTRWRHQGRAAGRGLDCAGLLWLSYAAAGLQVPDWTAYSRLADPETMTAALRAAGLEHVRGPVPRAGDVLYLRIAVDPQHLALYAGGGRMIHAYLPMRRVVEHRLDANWRGRIVSIWRHPEVTV